MLGIRGLQRTRAARQTGTAMNGPETRYVSVGDADVAYQVLGEGPLDLLYFYGMGSHIEFAWESRAYADFYMRLASFSRLIMFDRRGTGSSDGISRSAIPTWEEWTEDIVAVLDAAGSRRAAILAATDSGPIAILLAAMHPELVSALVLAQFNYILRNDVRQALPLIQAPTLVLHGKESALVPIAHGRYLAEHIDGATFVELPGGDSTTTPELYVIADEVAEFLTGERPVVEVERILTTVVFTDIVGSTARAASLGDKRWRSLLDAHDRTVRDELRRFRGRVINTTGDGFVASFDGPARAIRCSQAISQAAGKLGIELRIGLHTGECEVRGDDLGGLAVHIAARVGALAGPGEIVVSGTLKDLVVGSGIEFVDRGDHELKGVPGSWKLFAVVG